MSYIVPVLGSINTDHINWLTDRGPDALSKQKAEEGTFKAVLNDVIGNVIETEKQTKIDNYNLSIGNMDDTHTMMINSMKSEVALATMIELRNKLLDAYKEVMSMNM